jgi:hypothetical protein
MTLVTCTDNNYTEGPLINFTKFLLISLNKKNRELFLMLREKYSLLLEQDSIFEKVSPLY